MSENTETGCCPRFDPEPWEGRELSWQDRLFVKDRVRSFLHIPLNFGGVMVRNMNAITAADALDEDGMVLADENSLWGADVYIAVHKEVPGRKHARLSGDYVTRVFEGPYSQAHKWAKEMTAWLGERGKACTTLYKWYTTCPKCAKAYGKNYVVLLARQ